MKKIVLPLFLLLSACNIISSRDINSDIPETIKNPECEKGQKFEIFQTLDNGALAARCDSAYYCNGLTAFIPNNKDVEYFDGKQITLGREECFIYDGTYKYFNQNDTHKTVPKLKITSARIPNPDYLK